MNISTCIKYFIYIVWALFLVTDKSSKLYKINTSSYNL